MSLRGDRIVQLRKTSGYSQKALADRLNLSQNQISRYENNQMNPTPETLVAIAKLLNTSTDYLLGLTDNPTPATDQQPALTRWQVELIDLTRGRDEAFQQRLVEGLKRVWDVWFPQDDDKNDDSPTPP